MRNIWFTIYAGSNEQYPGITNYCTLLEMLLIPVVQDKINREKKAQKIMLMLNSDLESDNVDYFKGLFYQKKPIDGIINLQVSTKSIDWRRLPEQKRKDFLIEKWKVLFNNLSDDYFLTDKSEVLKSLDKLTDKEWKLSIKPIKRKVKYNNNTYSIVIELSVKQARLKLVRDSDGSWALLKDYETWKIHTDANFKSFKLEGDLLTLNYKNSFNTMFESPAVFNLREILK